MDTLEVVLLLIQLLVPTGATVLLGVVLVFLKHDQDRKLELAKGEIQQTVGAYQEKVKAYKAVLAFFHSERKRAALRAFAFREGRQPAPTDWERVPPDLPWAQIYLGGRAKAIWEKARERALEIHDEMMPDPEDAEHDLALWTWAFDEFVSVSRADLGVDRLGSSDLTRP